jgi:hypothetical protein
VPDDSRQSEFEVVCETRGTVVSKDEEKDKIIDLPKPPKNLNMLTFGLHLKSSISIKKSVRATKMTML